MSPLKIGSLIAGLCIAAVLALIALSPSTSANPDGSTSDLIGTTSPVIEAVSLDGEVISVSFDETSVAQDEWVVLNFFSLTCIGCIREHPALERFNQVLNESGQARMISALHGEADLEQVKDFFVKGNSESDALPWPVINQPRLAVDLKVKQLPETLVVDARGVIVLHIKGEAKCEELAGVVGIEPSKCGDV